MSRPERGPDAPSSRTPADARAVWIRSLPNRSNRYVIAFRGKSAHYCEAEGEVAVDKRCFGDRRVRGIRDCGARGKRIVFLPGRLSLGGLA